jgi:hypothetical protein
MKEASSWILYISSAAISLPQQQRTVDLSDAADISSSYLLTEARICEEVILGGNASEAVSRESNSSLSKPTAILTCALCCCCEVVVFRSGCSSSCIAKFRNRSRPLISPVDCGSDATGACRRRPCLRRRCFFRSLSYVTYEPDQKDRNQRTQTLQEMQTMARAPSRLVRNRSAGSAPLEPHGGLPHLYKEPRVDDVAAASECASVAVGAGVFRM